MSASGLRIEGIAKAYGKTLALDGIDLAVSAGEFVVLLGPSGSGKTTLLSILGGFIEPSAGRIWLGDRDITRTPPARRPTTTVFQDYALFPHMNVAKNVGFGLAMRGISGKERRERVTAALTLVGLADMGKRHINELSGGQRQRVALARALVVEPEVLLLDEPLGALDLKLRQQMQEELRQIQRRTHTTFIHVTHDQDEAMSLADTLVVLNSGRIEDCGPPDRVYLRPATRFAATFMGESNLLDGRIVAVSRVETRIGVITVPGAAAIGDRVSLALRPEQLLVDGALPNTVLLGRATLTGLTFSGSHLRACARADAIEWRLHLPPRSHLKPGDQVELSARSDEIVLLKH